MNFPGAPKAYVPVQAYEELKQKKAPVQYGPRIAGVVTYLQCAPFLPEDRLPEDRLVQVMDDVFKARLVPATLAAMNAMLSRE